MNDKTILHVDVNNFFASVEIRNDPKLRNKPVAVTGATEKRNGIILAKNYIAKSFGVKTGEVIFEAKQKCPNLICLPPHYALYEEISKQLQDLYLNYTDKIEPLGLDECWLDVTGSLKLLCKTGKQIADEIREVVKDKFNITVSVGVSFGKLFAKLGSDLKKPDATTVISKENFKIIIYPLPINAIIGIGRKNEIKFNKMNVFTLGEIIKIDDKILKTKFNITMVELKQKLLGNDNEEVCSYFHPKDIKSIGNGTTTIFDIMSREDISKTIVFLSEKISKRMVDLQITGSTIALTIKNSNLKRFSHSKKIIPTNNAKEIADFALELFDSFWKYDQKVRMLRIKLSNLSSLKNSRQLSMFSEKKSDLSECIANLKNKYGYDIITLASDSSKHINQDRRE